jgi:hypothetical protein
MPTAPLPLPSAVHATAFSWLVGLLRADATLRRLGVAFQVPTDDDFGNELALTDRPAVRLTPSAGEAVPMCLVEPGKRSWLVPLVVKVETRVPGFLWANASNLGFVLWSVLSDADATQLRAHGISSIEYGAPPQATGPEAVGMGSVTLTCYATFCSVGPRGPSRPPRAASRHRTGSAPRRRRARASASGPRSGRSARAPPSPGSLRSSPAVPNRPRPTPSPPRSYHAPESHKMAEVVQASCVPAITVTGSNSIATGQSTSSAIKLPDSYTPVSFANGTGAKQVTVKWSDTRTYSATPTTLDLTTLAAASTNTGAAAFSSIKLVQITNNSTTAGYDVIIGAAAATAFTGFLGGTTPTITLQPGASILIFSTTAAGWACGTNKSLKIDPGVNNVNVSITLVGN